MANVKHGYLSEYFEGVAAKRLAAVEIDTECSSQHEFNASAPLLGVLGRPEDKQRFDATFLYLDDDVDASLSETSTLTLYDARRNHATRTEYRLYFPTTAVSRKAEAGDLLVLAKRSEGDILAVIARENSTIAGQLIELFGLSGEDMIGFVGRRDLAEEQDRVDLVASMILEAIGVAIKVSEDDDLDRVLTMFGGQLPETIEFSAYARSLLRIDSRDDADAALMAWMEREERLFRQFEHHLIGDRIKSGFETVDDFIAFSLSVQNRRKSRVGHALENHLAAVFEAYELRFARGAKTENKARPDFLFPGNERYHDAAYPPALLTMLAAKSTCKDRWRQVLAEADRIDPKHLLTLETAISPAQTTEMQYKRLQLVIPRALQATYLPAQREWLMDLASFVDLVRKRQAGAPAEAQGSLAL